MCFRILFSERARELLVLYEEEQFKVRKQPLTLCIFTCPNHFFLLATFMRSPEKEFERKVAGLEGTSQKERGGGTRKETREAVSSWLTLQTDGREQMMEVGGYLLHWVVGNNWA